MMIGSVMTIAPAAIEPVGSSNCELPVKFAAKLHKMQVIANVYVDGRWNRVEHFHDECYLEADSPFGDADASSSTNTRRA